MSSSSAEKCIFVQILYHACQTYWDGKAGSLGKVGRRGRASQSAQREVGAGAGLADSTPGSASRTLQARRKSYVPPRRTEFINCQSKLTGGRVTSPLRFMILWKSFQHCCNVLSLILDACTMNLVIYRCKAFLNRMKNMMVANKSRSSARGKAVIK